DQRGQPLRPGPHPARRRPRRGRRAAALPAPALPRHARHRRDHRRQLNRAVPTLGAPPHMTVRKNQASLTAGEKRRFVAALLELKRSGRCDAFVSTHNDFIVSDTDHGRRTGHRSPSFLPWHRRFLLEFERALQSVDASVALPYWDWTTDSSVRSSLWAPDFLGGSGRNRDGRVTDGPFAASTGNWPIAVRVDERTYLRRALGAGGLRLPTRADVES